eukprot:scaffold139748_cov27-Prasinocladus_malaysianus.AAC.2
MVRTVVYLESEPKRTRLEPGLGPSVSARKYNGDRRRSRGGCREKGAPVGQAGSGPFHIDGVNRYILRERAR